MKSNHFSLAYLKKINLEVSNDLDSFYEKLNSACFAAGWGLQWAFGMRFRMPNLTREQSHWIVLIFIPRSIYDNCCCSWKLRKKELRNGLKIKWLQIVVSVKPWAKMQSKVKIHVQTAEWSLCFTSKLKGKNRKQITCNLARNWSVLRFRSFLFFSKWWYFLSTWKKKFFLSLQA